MAKCCANWCVLLAYLMLAASERLVASERKDVQSHSTVSFQGVVSEAKTPSGKSLEEDALGSGPLSSLADVKEMVIADDASVSPPSQTSIKTLSWNVAAINNNPFEYWITHPNPQYKQLMKDVEGFMEEPGEDDRTVEEIFDDDKFQALKAKMAEAGMDGLPTVQRMWDEDYRHRHIVSEFMKDKLIGSKRLASMPDRVSNTIQRKSGTPLYRPTVINCYPGELNTLDSWFEQWLNFWFDTDVDINGNGESVKVYTMLKAISKAKYPKVTEEEEAVNKPLQLVMQAIFDAVLVHLMQIKAGDIWQSLRTDICESLNTQKNELIGNILRDQYSSFDVFFLQEVGNDLVVKLRDVFDGTHYIQLPSDYDDERNQNSVILLKRSIFSEPDEVVDVDKVDGQGAGDLLVLKTSIGEKEMVLASFHGDTNGLQTAPVLEEVMRSADEADLPLLFGMDANTYERVADAKANTYNVLDFEKMYKGEGLESCWGAVNPKTYTAYNARTYLQPQLNKASKSTEIELGYPADLNPKDFILFTSDFSAGEVQRDNTGRGTYVEGEGEAGLPAALIPTLQFPSDHVVVAVDIFLSGGYFE